MIIDLKSQACSQESPLFFYRLVRLCFNHAFTCPLLSELVASYELAVTRNVDPSAGHAAAAGESEGEGGDKVRRRAQGTPAGQGPAGVRGTWHPQQVTWESPHFPGMALVMTGALMNGPPVPPLPSCRGPRLLAIRNPRPHGGHLDGLQG